VLADRGRRAARARPGRPGHRRLRLRERIATFFGESRSDDLLLVHFSCHGVLDDAGELHLAARDTRTGPLLGATGIEASWLVKQITQSRSKRVVLLLDCCFSGAFPFGLRPRVGQDVPVVQHLGGRGRVVITASSAMEFAWEGDRLTGEASPSVFTEAVLEGLETGRADRDGDHWISVEELYDFVYEQVQQRMPHQRPRIKSEVEGRILIARNAAAPPVEPLDVDPHLRALARSHLFGARLGAVSELAELLEGTNPFLAQAARAELRRLSDDDSARVSAAARSALGEQREVVDEPAHTPPQHDRPARATLVPTSPWNVRLPAAPAPRAPTAVAAVAPASSVRPIVSPPVRAPSMPARLREHVVAMLLDAPIVLVVGILAALIPALPLIPLSDTVSSAVYYIAILPLGAAAYAGLLGRRGRRRTLGQWLCSLYVIRARGGWPTTRQRMLREGLKWFVPLGVAWLVHQGWRRAHGERWGRPFHDVLARTNLVRERR
jgi:uncharacterized RDD family membrane protein YckC